MHLRTMTAVFAAVGMLVLAATAGAATTHVITQQSLSFSPSNITIQAGDTVEWHWTSGSHTVTSGTGTSDPSVGSLFDESLNSGNSVVSFTFNSPGTVPFFCRPHEFANMKGQIEVQPSVGSASASFSAIKALYEAGEDD